LYNLKVSNSSSVHGDLTVENILVDQNLNWVLIDPNPNNLFNSKFIDTAKLLQSLNMGYEFLQKTEDIQINGNVISFKVDISHQYIALYNELNSKYLLKNYSDTEYMEIKLHEFINYLRLIEYKANKNPQKAVLFYCIAVILANQLNSKYPQLHLYE
jgi:hypothetical protein